MASSRFFPPGTLLNEPDKEVVLRIFLVWWVVMPLALLMACERRRWSDWLEDDADDEPLPLLSHGWGLWLRIRPFYEWLEWRLWAPYRAIRWRWFPPRPEDFEPVVGPDGLTPEETLLRHIEWDMNPAYCQIKAAWEEYLKLRDTAGDTQGSSAEDPD